MRRNLFILAVATALLAGCQAEQPTAVTDIDTETDAAGKAIIQDESEIDGHRRRIPEVPPPDEFVASIDNPWLAFEVGKVFRYEGETDEGTETVVTTVTNQTKVILGVTTTVVHDQTFLDGELIENTFDWFAQDEDGNVWYFGEHSEEIENGEVVSTEGSWEAGVDGAEPGIIMLARPRRGMEYKQEDAEGVAEDEARVVSRDANVRVDFGRFEDVLQIRERNPLEDNSTEYKFYARGVGLVLESERRSGRGDRLELVAIEP